MFKFIFWLIGTLIWIAVIIAVIAVLRNKNNSLFRSSENKVLVGVCGGIGEYFNLDPTIVRFIWILVTVCGGAGIVAYIVAALAMPSR